MSIFKQWAYVPELDRNALIDAGLTPLPSQYFGLSLLRHNGTIKNLVYKVFGIEDKVVHMPAQTLTDLPAGTYRFSIFSEGEGRTHAFAC